MLTILIRTLLVYILLIGTMRFMGKRQLGELEISELVTTLLLSELATMPIANQSVPLMHAVIPLVTILTVEIALSFILIKCPRLKNLASARPSVLVRHGRLDQKELRRIRISLDELFSEIRGTGLSSIEEVDYAILEQNGKISIIPKRSAQPPTAKDLHTAVTESGILHILIGDGTVNDYNLQLLGHDRLWLSNILKEKKLRIEQLFLFGMDDAEKFYWIKKEANKP